jgi:hypothetical protein
MNNPGYIPLPSLADLAAQRLTLEIPWHKEYRALGASFDSRCMNASQGPWKEGTAFEENPSRKVHYILDAHGGTFSYRDSSSASHFDSTEHLSANIGVSVGCKVASVGVSGSYDKTVLEQRNVSESSTLRQAQNLPDEKYRRISNHLGTQPARSVVFFSPWIQHSPDLQPRSWQPPTDLLLFEKNMGTTLSRATSLAQTGALA